MLAVIPVLSSLNIEMMGKLTLEASENNIKYKEI